MLNYAEIIPQLQAIMQLASVAILEIYNAPDEDWEVEIKSDDSPLTRADYASNAILSYHLQELYPEIHLLSEEGYIPPFSERQHYDYVWIIDPLDGTKEFIKRNGEFTINVALVHRNEVVLSGVQMPTTGEFYWAIKGKGAFCINAQGETRPLRAAQFHWQESGLNVVCSRSHLNKPTEDFIAQMQSPKLVAVGGSLKFLQIATGQTHLYPRFQTQMKEWDIAAPQLLIEEAGGLVLDWHTRQPLRYNARESLMVTDFVALGKCPKFLYYHS